MIAPLFIDLGCLLYQLSINCLLFSYLLRFSYSFLRCVLGLAEDFFKDLQDEFRNWESSVSSQGKPKSLWEELAVSTSFLGHLQMGSSRHHLMFPVHLALTQVLRNLIFLPWGLAGNQRRVCGVSGEGAQHY